MLPLGQHRKESIERHHAVHGDTGIPSWAAMIRCSLRAGSRAGAGLRGDIDKFAGLVAMLAQMARTCLTTSQANFISDIVLLFFSG